MKQRAGRAGGVDQTNELPSLVEERLVQLVLLNQLVDAGFCGGVSAAKGSSTTEFGVVDVSRKEGSGRMVLCELLKDESWLDSTVNSID